MANMLILSPLATAGIVASGGTGVANLLTPDPKEIWAAATTANQSLTIDMGATVAFDTVFLGFTNADAAAAMTITYGPTTGFESVLVSGLAMRAAADAIGPRYPAFHHRAAGTVSGRYIVISMSGQSSAPIQAGILAIGAAFKPIWNNDWGSGRRIIDTGGKTRLRGGGFGLAAGAIVPGFQWTFGNLTDAEVRALWALAMRSGEGRPVVVCEDPDTGTGLAERLHYGLFDRFEPFERQDPDLTRWALSIEGWA